MFPKIDPLSTDAWQRLQIHYNSVKDERISDLFQHDPGRFKSFSITHGDILFDYSKNFLTVETRDLLLQLAKETKLKEAILAMFSGEKINETEGRAVLHTALRDFTENEILVDGINIKPGINAVLAQVKDFCNKIHSGEWTGYSGKKIKYIVNIGIGGSDLGPVMVTEALKPYWHSGIEAYFVSNVDASHISETLKKIKAEETLFLVASKTFTTQETMTNAISARDWFLENGGNEKDIAKHFVAISTNKEAVIQFGIAAENMFVFWDWVGGRYSLWSAIGLSIAVTIGYENYEQLLKGAHDADIHFLQTDLEKNIPVMMGLVGIWLRNFYGAATEAILPYDQYMHRFPAYFQQGNMESNGKQVDREGNKITYQTGPVIWGEPGTNGQHAFYQLIHQGTQIVPCDFIAAAQSHNELGDHQQKLLNNFFAQTEALMNGADNKIAHRNFSGNRPTNSFLINRITPFTLGQLIAFYEHKIFVQGVIWNIFSFDQFGVELGKILASKILPELLNDHPISSHDSSTNGLINTYKNMRS
ncbi:MAG: glucose-6-phosphate isomerase [Ferruginibacter sp.]